MRRRTAGLAPELKASYDACRRLNAVHGKTYYLATLLLPPAKRPAVHALYGFARAADEVVDNLGTTLTVEERARRLDTWSAAVLRPSATPGGESRPGDPIPALRDTIERYAIPLHLFESFLASMRMDLTVCEYATYDELAVYMYGSAAVIGLQMLPVLGHPDVPYETVGTYARDLGLAFQLTNFIRDVGEDLRRGRVYLPQDSLALFGVTRAQLAGGVVDGPIRRLLAHEIARARELYAAAEPGVRLLDPTSRDCIYTALTLYRDILGAIEDSGYEVLAGRVTVPRVRRAAIVAPGLIRAVRARRR